MDRREHHRVQLRIPARLRWTTPFGQKTEVCDTLNVCRGGVLVPCEEAHVPGATLWITFPYDASVPYGQPEIPARVVRFDGAERNAHAMNASGNARAGEGASATSGHAAPGGNGAHGPAAALRFEIAPHPQANGNGHKREYERRTSPRSQLALPIRVRPENIPWFEETMTLDVSSDGLRFLSSREYVPGQHLIVSVDPATSLPWATAREYRAQVVRAEAMPQSSALVVAMRRADNGN
jgi:hypothetical protein